MKTLREFFSLPKKESKWPTMVKKIPVVKRHLERSDQKSEENRTPAPPKKKKKRKEVAISRRFTPSGEFFSHTVHKVKPDLCQALTKQPLSSPAESTPLAHSSLGTGPRLLHIGKTLVYTMYCIRVQCTL